MGPGTCFQTLSMVVLARVSSFVATQTLPQNQPCCRERWIGPRALTAFSAKAGAALPILMMGIVITTMKTVTLGLITFTAPFPTVFTMSTQATTFAAERMAMCLHQSTSQPALRLHCFQVV